MRQNTAAALAMATLSMAFAAHVYTGELSSQQEWVKSILRQPSDLTRQLLADAGTPLPGYTHEVSVSSQPIAFARTWNSEGTTSCAMLGQ